VRYQGSAGVVNAIAGSGRKFAGRGKNETKKHCPQSEGRRAACRTDSFLQADCGVFFARQHCFPNFKVGDTVACGQAVWPHQVRALCGESVRSLMPRSTLKHWRSYQLLVCSRGWSLQCLQYCRPKAVRTARSQSWLVRLGRREGALIYGKRGIHRRRSLDRSSAGGKEKLRQGAFFGISCLVSVHHGRSIRLSRRFWLRDSADVHGISVGAKTLAYDFGRPKRRSFCCLVSTDAWKVVFARIDEHRLRNFGSRETGVRWPM